MRWLKYSPFMEHQEESLLVKIRERCVETIALCD